MMQPCLIYQHVIYLIAITVGPSGRNSYYGSGSWIAGDGNGGGDVLADVERRWCPELFERPLGAPKVRRHSLQLHSLWRIPTAAVSSLWRIPTAVVS